MAAITITPFFVAVFVLAQIPLTFMVGLYRTQHDIHFLHGDDVTLLRRMRAHANFTETVPISLLAMLTAELTGMPRWGLWTCGLFLVAGRVMHLVQLLINGWGLGRSLGMILTFSAMAGPAFWLLQVVFK